MRQTHAARDLTLVEYEHGERRARVERVAADRWVMFGYVGRAIRLRLERPSSLRARQAAREWVEERRQPMRRQKVTGICAGFFLMLAATAAAQTVNPRFLEFTSADHAQVTRYELGYFAVGASAPVQTVNVAKAEFTAQPDNYWRTALPRPVFGTYVLRARAWAPVPGGGEIDSGWSTDQTLPFALAPLAPVALRTPQ